MAKPIQMTLVELKSIIDRFMSPLCKSTGYGWPDEWSTDHGKQDTTPGPIGQRANLSQVRYVKHLTPPAGAKLPNGGGVDGTGKPKIWISLQNGTADWDKEWYLRIFDDNNNLNGKHSFGVVIAGVHVNSEGKDNEEEMKNFGESVRAYISSTLQKKSPAQAMSETKSRLSAILES